MWYPRECVGKWLEKICVFHLFDQKAVPASEHTHVNCSVHKHVNMHTCSAKATPLPPTEQNQTPIH